MLCVKNHIAGSVLCTSSIKKVHVLCTSGADVSTIHHRQFRLVEYRTAITVFIIITVWIYVYVLGLAVLFVHPTQSGHCVVLAFISLAFTVCNDEIKQ